MLEELPGRRQVNAELGTTVHWAKVCCRGPTMVGQCCQDSHYRQATLLKLCENFLCIVLSSNSKGSSRDTPPLPPQCR